MRNVIPVDILNAIDNLLEIKPSIVFSNITILHILIQLPFIGEFHYDKDIVSGV
jgi:hypothetical protein